MRRQSSPARKWTQTCRNCPHISKLMIVGTTQLVKVLPKQLRFRSSRRPLRCAQVPPSSDLRKKRQCRKRWRNQLGCWKDQTRWKGVPIDHLLVANHFRKGSPPANKLLQLVQYLCVNSVGELEVFNPWFCECVPQSYYLS